MLAGVVGPVGEAAACFVLVVGVGLLRPSGGPVVRVLRHSVLMPSSSVVAAAAARVGNHQDGLAGTRRRGGGNPPAPTLAHVAVVDFTCNALKK